jgi:hypothetical protein
MTSLTVGLNKKRVVTLLIVCFVAVLLEGCKFVEVFVKVDSCPPATGTRVVTGGGTTGGEQDGEGGCFVGSFYNGQAATFWHMALKREITSSDNFSCVGASSKKCPSPAGTCTGGNCKSRYYPLTATTGSCNCGCVY